MKQCFGWVGGLGSLKCIWTTSAFCCLVFFLLSSSGSYFHVVCRWMFLGVLPGFSTWFILSVNGFHEDNLCCSDLQMMFRGDWDKHSCDDLFAFLFSLMMSFT